MSLSKEWFEYHLTPEGWIEGSERIDFGKTTEKPIPSGRVLSIRGYEELPHAFSKPHCRVEVLWKDKASERVNSLVKEFGKLPKGISQWGDYQL